MLNGSSGTMVQQFLDDVIAQQDIAWGNYHIPAGQWDNVLAQLSLLHSYVRCIVELDHDMICEEEVSWCGVSPVQMPHRLTLYILAVP